MLRQNDFDDSDDARRRAYARGGGVWIVLAIVLVGAGVWAVRRWNGPAPAFSADPDGKPVMLMFTADWCGPCQAFKARVLSDAAVLDRLGKSCGFRTVDLTTWAGRPAETAKYYDVDAIPALILVNAHGREISRYSGPHDPRSFGQWIDQNTR